MFSQIACLNRWKVANGCTCTLFSTLSSNCVLELMQSHIFCIFVLFSRVSLSVLNLPACADAKSHWLHLYAFSPNGVFRCFLKSSLNRWKVANGCTCMLFSTVSSNCLPEKMQSRIGCIFTLFSPEGVFKCFLKSPD